MKINLNRNDVVDGFCKGLQVLEVFDEKNNRLTATSAAELSGISRTSARRYLLSLVGFGYAETDGKYFWLTPRVLRIGRNYLLGSNIMGRIAPIIRHAAAQCGETTSFGVLDAHEVVYLAFGSLIENSGAHAGFRFSAHRDAHGIAALSALSRSDFDRWMEISSDAKSLRLSEAEFSFLKNQVDIARHNGYSSLNSPWNGGKLSVAIPLRDHVGKCHGAVGAQVDKNCVDISGRIEKWIFPVLQQAASRIARAL